MSEDDLVRRLQVGHDSGCAMSYGMHEHCCDCSYPDRQESAETILKLRQDLAAARANLEIAERALLAHGYRKSCDIPACNCGDRWHHGGNAVARLVEIRDAISERESFKNNGKTILQCVKECVRSDIDLTEARALNEAMIANLPGPYYMDPPDGGSVNPEEQMRRLAKDAERYRWLRGDVQDDFSTRWSRWRIEHWASPGPTWSDIRGADLDAAIDASMGDAP